MWVVVVCPTYTDESSTSTLITWPAAESLLYGHAIARLDKLVTIVVVFVLVVVYYDYYYFY